MSCLCKIIPKSLKVNRIVIVTLNVTLSLSLIESIHLLHLLDFLGIDQRLRKLFRRFVKFICAHNCAGDYESGLN